MFGTDIVYYPRGSGEKLLLISVLSSVRITAQSEARALVIMRHYCLYDVMHRKSLTAGITEVINSYVLS